LFTLWVVATINFLVFSYIAAQPEFTFFGHWAVAPTTQQMILRTYGWIDPIPIRYVKYLGIMFTYGTVPPYFGWSVLDRNFVSVGMAQRLPITLVLIGSGIMGCIIFGIVLGVYVASKRGTKRSLGVTVSSLLTWCVPLFLIQSLAILFFGLVLRDTYGISLLPTTFNVLPFSADLSWFATCMQRLALPILTLILVGYGPWVLRSRNLLVDVLAQDYIITARAKGVGERTILYKHALRSVLPSISTMISSSMPAVVTGSMVTEILFGINGIGSWFARVIESKTTFEYYLVLDPAVVQAVFFIYATIIIVINLLADISYAIFDPRIRVGARR
jgi:peptide/nickel transport system permease protein